MITLEQYLGPYRDHVDATPEVREAAVTMLGKVQSVMDAAQDDGHRFSINQQTQCWIGGSGNGGFRPKACLVGAANSAHKLGRGIDVYDHERLFARWCLKNLALLEENGLYMEDPRWTPTWVHLDDRGPRSGNRVFVPSPTPALAKALPEQEFA